MNFEEFNAAVKAMTPEGKASSVSFDILNSSTGGVYPTVKAYISEVGWTGCHESYEAALVELDAKVKGFDAPKIAEGGYPELAVWSNVRVVVANNTIQGCDEEGE